MFSFPVCDGYLNHGETVHNGQRRQIPVHAVVQVEAVCNLTPHQFQRRQKIAYMLAGKPVADHVPDLCRKLGK
ncbi:hypothetical protein D3C74_431030 [compost metagenome]